jgi:hypothetical protein
MKSILDPSFRYSNSVETDLRKTFARVRREQRTPKEPRSDPAAGTAGKLLPHPNRIARP